MVAHLDFYKLIPSASIIDSLSGKANLVAHTNAEFVPKVYLGTAGGQRALQQKDDNSNSQL